MLPAVIFDSVILNDKKSSDLPINNSLNGLNSKSTSIWWFLSDIIGIAL